MLGQQYRMSVGERELRGGGGGGRGGGAGGGGGTGEIKREGERSKSRESCAFIPLSSESKATSSSAILFKGTESSWDHMN